MLERTRRKGKGKDKKGKSKGKSKSSQRYPLRHSNLTLEDRKRRLAMLKAETACRDCGRKGHLSGDAACTMKKNHAIVKELKDALEGRERGNKEV